VFPRIHSGIAVGFLACLALAATGSAADNGPANAAPVEVGLKVGERAPQFTLPDQDGHEIKLQDLLKKGPVAVVFHRSAEWCLFCKFELVHLQNNLKNFEAAGGQVVAISYDSQKVLKDFADRKSITFPLLSDQSSRIIEAFRVRDRSATDPTNRFSAHVAFVLDRGGIVRAKLADVIIRQEPGISFLVNAVKEARNDLGEAKPKQQTSIPPTEAALKKPTNS
jgi:peroxiredoxin